MSSPRITYFATVPLVASAAIAFLRLREPQLHRAAERVSYRRQAIDTLRALTGRPELRRVVLLAALTAMAAQVIFEFGPLWLVSVHAPSGLYGPYWAALVSTRRPRRLADVAARLRPHVGRVDDVAPRRSWPRSCSSRRRRCSIVIAMQVVVALVAAIVGVRASFLMHDAIEAGIRAGVSSGASTLAWITFVPLSLVFGWLSRAHGVHTAGWLLVLIAVGLAALVRGLPRPAAASA